MDHMLPSTAPTMIIIIKQQIFHRGYLTHWGLDKMAANFQMTFWNAFSLMKIHEFWFTEVCYQGSNWQYYSIGTDNGLAPVRRQAIVWPMISSLLTHIHHSASMCYHHGNNRAAMHLHQLSQNVAWTKLQKLQWHYFKKIMFHDSNFTETCFLWSEWQQVSKKYCQTSNISHTKSKNLNVSRLVMQLSLPNPLKPCVKPRMKM